MDLFMCGEIKKKYKRVLLTRKSTFSPKECFKPEKVCFKLERVLCLSGWSEIKIVAVFSFIAFLGGVLAILSVMML